MFENNKCTNAIFNYALQYIRNYEVRLTGKEAAKNNVNDIWKEIKTINYCKTSLPSNIDGVRGSEISHLWQKQYYILLNCVNE